jgi:hypothetical protein
MTIRIIDNKKIDLTDDENEMYQKIVKSYTTINMDGKDLFTDLFYSDDRGIIVFLKPPSVRRTSFEVFLFLMSIFQHQHTRLMYEQVEDICQQMKAKMNEIDEKLKKISSI